MALRVERERGVATFRAEKLLFGEAASNLAEKFEVGEDNTSIQIFLKWACKLIFTKKQQSKD